MATRRLTYIFPPGNTTDVCQLQTRPANAGPLILNGNLANRITNTVSFITKGYSRQIVISSAGNNNGVVFTINGIQNGVNITEPLTMPNGVNQLVYGTLIYDVITSISCGVGFANPISVGTGWNGFFSLIQLNTNSNLNSYNLTLAQTSIVAQAVNTYTIFGTVSNLANNGLTYLVNTMNNYNVFQIGAVQDNVSQYNYQAIAGQILYNQLLIQIGAVGNIANGVELNFIQY